MSLFATKPEQDEPRGPRPLADRMRPLTLDEFVGQEKLLGAGKPLRTQIERDEITSMILWGPPGCGKTTLARIIARMTRSDFISFSAVLSGIKEIKTVMAAAERSRRAGRRTIIFIDEVHRFNKAQQDAFLPHVEAGNVILIGATTENPSFEVIAPLLSRAKVYVLAALSPPQLVGLLRRALADPRAGYGGENRSGRRPARAHRVVRQRALPRRHPAGQTQFARLPRAVKVRDTWRSGGRSSTASTADASAHSRRARRASGGYG